jgi:hypothetical protein
VDLFRYEKAPYSEKGWARGAFKKIEYYPKPVGPSGGEITPGERSLREERRGIGSEKL